MAHRSPQVTINRENLFSTRMIWHRIAAEFWQELLSEGLIAGRLPDHLAIRLKGREAA